MASNVTSTVKQVYVCAADPLFTVRAATTNYGWTTHHIYVGGQFLFSVGTATHDFEPASDGATRAQTLAEAIAYCDKCPKRKFRGMEKKIVEEARAAA